MKGLSTREAAKELVIHLITLQRHVSAGRIPRSCYAESWGRQGPALDGPRYGGGPQDSRHYQTREEKEAVRSKWDASLFAAANAP